METGLPSRFVLYRDGVGVIAHGVEWGDGYVALKGRLTVSHYNHMATLWENECTDGVTWVSQYDEDEQRDAA